ncbi:MAG: restriction endonuclease [Candidatus Entotheonellia bacterium]
MSTSDTPKWKVTENVVAAIERSLNAVQGARVIPNASIRERVSGVPRQVDVYVEIPTGPRVLRVGVEVRDKSAPLDLPEVEQLIAKLKKLDIDYGCVVSRAGFTVTAKEEADRNGIELRTIAEVENPDWWLASAMLRHLRQVELLHFQVNFRPEELAHVTPLLAGATGTDLELTLTSGEPGTLNAFVAAQGIRAVDRPELAHLTDQDTFTVMIDFSDLSGASLKCPRGPVPLPQNVYALYRLHLRVESVKLAAYQGPQGVNAFTGVSSGWKKQITLVTKLHPDGTRSISFTTDDPTPPKTAIGRRGENAEQSHSLDAQKDACG